MDLRQYDPAIARWTSIDPVTHFNFSTYTAFDNNPVFWADPSGADSESFIMDLFNNSSSGTTWTNNGNGSFSDGNGNTEQCDDCKDKKKKKSQSKPVKEMSAGEFYGMAYNGAARTAFLNGNDPYNPTDADIAQNERAKQEAAGQVVLFLAGEWAFAKVLQGGVWVYRFIKARNLIKGAKWAQKTYSGAFSAGGRFAGKTVDEVAAGLRSGSISPGDVPIDIVVRNGQTLILNTRSSAALTKAGVSRGSWNVVNRTGQEFFENQLTNQLTRNSLNSAGTSTIRQSGTTNVISH